MLAGRIRPGYRPDLPRDRVRLIGPLAEADLPLFYSAAAVLVNASLYEGFGLTLVEAMACGCPVIALRRSAVPEVTGDAALAPRRRRARRRWRAPPVAMLGDPAAAARHRALGRLRATEFSWARVAAAVEAVYLGALA